MDASLAATKMEGSYFFFKVDFVAEKLPATFAAVNMKVLFAKRTFVAANLSALCSNKILHLQLRNCGNKPIFESLEFSKNIILHVIKFKCMEVKINVSVAKISKFHQCWNYTESKE